MSAATALNVLKTNVKLTLARLSFYARPQSIVSVNQVTHAPIVTSLGVAQTPTKTNVKLSILVILPISPTVSPPQLALAAVSRTASVAASTGVAITPSIDLGQVLHPVASISAPAVAVAPVQTKCIEYVNACAASAIANTPSTHVRLKLLALIPARGVALLPTLHVHLLPGVLACVPGFVNPTFQTVLVVETAYSVGISLDGYLVWGPPPAIDIAVGLDATALPVGMVYRIADIAYSIAAFPAATAFIIAYDPVSTPQLRILSRTSQVTILPTHVKVRILEE